MIIRSEEIYKKANSIVKSCGTRDTLKIARELGWTPAETFTSGMRKTVAWYLANETWWRQVQDGSYQGERLGLQG